MSTNISKDDWLKAISDIGYETVDDQSAVTIREYADMMGIPLGTASGHLRSLEKHGRAVKTTKRCASAAGRMLMHVAYKLVELKKKG